MIKSGMIYIKSLMVLFILLFTSVLYSFAAVVKLNPASTVQGATIFLKDIAVIDAEAAVKEKAGNIKIASSPIPGKEKTISSRFIRSKIFAAFKGEKPDIIQPGEMITVKRAYQVVGEASLQQLYNEYVRHRLKDKKIRVRGIKIKGNKKMPTGSLKLEVRESRAKKNSGHIRMVVDAIPETGRKQRILISGWVDVYEDIVYAKNAIKKGTMIKAGDLYTELTNITKYPPDLMGEISLIVGQIAKKNIRKNSALRSNMAGTSPDIKKGEMIKLVVHTGGITVTTIGVATNDACVGDQLRVKNLSSKKIVTGQVLDSKMVRVVF